MPPHPCPTVDELLGDSLIQAVMRADNVEPQALRALLVGAAGRNATRPTTPGATNGPASIRPAPEGGCVAG